MTDIIKAITTQISEAVETHNQGEDVHYAVSMAIMPGQDGNPVPVIVVVISIPGALVGSRLTATHADANIQELPTTPDMIRQMIEQLLQARSEQMKQSLAAPSAQAAKNGHHPPGLIDPRQGM